MSRKRFEPHLPENQNPTEYFRSLAHQFIEWANEPAINIEQGAGPESMNSILRKAMAEYRDRKPYFWLGADA